MRIALTDYGSVEQVLTAIRDLPYDGGSRRTGEALRFLVDTAFSPAIIRDNSPKVRGLFKSSFICGIYILTRKVCCLEVIGDLLHLCVSM